MTPLHRALCHATTAFTTLAAIQAKNYSGEMPPTETLTSIGLSAAGSIGLEVINFVAQRKITSLDLSKKVMTTDKVITMLTASGAVAAGGAMLYFGAPELAQGLAYSVVDGFDLAMHAITDSKSIIFTTKAASTLLKASSLFAGISKSLQGLGMMSIARDLIRAGYHVKTSQPASLPI